MGFIGDIFGKGSSAPATPAMPPAPDYSGEMAGMMEMMQGIMGGMMTSMQSQAAHMMEQASQQQNSLLAQMEATMPAMPETYRDPEVDWSEKNDQLAAKAKADYNLDLLRRKGRQDTVLSSPLLDEEDANVTGSVLAGD